MAGRSCPVAHQKSLVETQTIIKRLLTIDLYSFSGFAASKYFFPSHFLANHFVRQTEPMIPTSIQTPLSGFAASKQRLTGFD
jgi:hypothetical protein